MAGIWDCLTKTEDKVESFIVYMEYESNYNKWIKSDTLQQADSSLFFHKLLSAQRDREITLRFWPWFRLT